jgi:hypothetical protein
VQFDPEHIASIAFPEAVEPPRAVLAMGIYPKVGTPWIFVLHQCSYARTWDSEEERLFVQIGHRLADALTGLIAYQDVRESAQKLAQAGRVAPGTGSVTSRPSRSATRREPTRSSG